jgi:hypothetical protein
LTNVSLAPQPLKSATCRARVARRVSWVAMTKVVLDHTEICAPISQRKTARVAKHVWPHTTQACALARLANEVVHGLARHGLFTLGKEYRRTRARL